MNENPKYQYVEVGTDEQGRPLYQRTPIETDSLESIEGEESDRASNHPKTGRRRKISGVYDYMSPELIELRHKRSMELYPDLNLHEQEFVLMVLRRHSIGYILIWVVDALVLVLLAVLGMVIYTSDLGTTLSGATMQANRGFLFLGLISAMLIFVLFGWVGTSIYRANQLYVTTERLIQYIAFGLFDRKQQTIDLPGVEDVSYHQRGLWMNILGIGDVKMSTIGDESTYRFAFVGRPKAVAANVNEIVQAVKNHRPLPKLEEIE